MAKRKTLQAQVAELTAEVRALREEIGALRAAQPVQFVPVPYPYTLPNLQPWYPQIWYKDEFTITCGTES